MKNKQTANRRPISFLFFLVLFLLVTLFFLHFLRQNQPADYSDAEIKTSLSTIATFDYSKVKNVEAEIRELELNEAQSTFDPSQTLDAAQYQKIFNNCVVIGDSITEGLSAYGYLSEDQVFSEIGASAMSGDSLCAAAANTYPRVAFLAFGMNDMGNYDGDAAAFIKKYRQLISDFQKTSPDTRILVNGITPPTADAIAGNSSLGYWQKFNTALQQMCKDLSLRFVDTQSIVQKHPDLYAGDGIHLDTSFYPLLLNLMIVKSGL